MADQTRKPKPKKEEEAPQASESTSTEEKDEELDDLLDEIDEVLESNAEDFVRGFVQKGGQGLIPVTLLTEPNLPLVITVLLMFAIVRIWTRQRAS